MKQKIVLNSLKEPPEISSKDLAACEIAQWIADDIQHYIPQIDEYILELSEFAKEKRAGIHLGTGNAHSFYAHENYVFIECEFVDEFKVLLATEKLVLVLTQYKNFIEYQRNPCTIEVDFIAEGAEAEKQFLKLADVEDLSDLVQRRTGGGHYFN